MMKTLETIKQTADQKLKLIGLSELYLDALEDGNKVNWLEQQFTVDLEIVKENYLVKENWELADATDDMIRLVELNRLRRNRSTKEMVLTFDEYEDDLDPGCEFQDWFLEAEFNFGKSHVPEEEAQRLFFAKADEFGYVNELKSVKQDLGINPEEDAPEEKKCLVQRNLFGRLEYKLERKKDDLLADLVLQVEKILKETDQELLEVSEFV